METANRLRWVLGTLIAGLASLTTLGALIPMASETPQQRARVNAYREMASILAAQPAYSVSRACSFVHATTKHSVERRITWHENWVQASLGLLYPPMVRTQSPERIIARQHADCSERVAALQRMFRQARLPTRIVGLGGHVVLEVKANGKWYTTDPDYGVTYGVGVAQLETGTGQGVHRLLQRVGCSDPVIDRYLEILHSTSDNVVMGINQPLSPRLALLEGACGWLLVAIPLILWVGLAVLWVAVPSRDTDRIGSTH
jgi:hypothetical protein